LDSIISNIDGLMPITGVAQGPRALTLVRNGFGIASKLDALVRNSNQGSNDKGSSDSIKATYSIKVDYWAMGAKAGNDVKRDSTYPAKDSTILNDKNIKWRIIKLFNLKKSFIMNRLLSLIIITLILFTSCSNIQVINDYYESGELKTKTEVVDNLKNGKQLGYYKSGEVEFIKHWRNNEIDSTCKYFYRSGVIKSIYKYSQGSINGYYTSYYESGNVHEERLYNSGQIIECFTYFDSSNLLKEIKKYHIIDGENQINELIVFNKNQDTLIGESNFLKTIIPRDTIKLGDKFHAKIKLTAPYFDKSRIIGYFAVPDDSVNIREIYSGSYTINYEYKPTEKGIYPLSGYIYEIEVGGNDDSVAIRKMFFNYKYHVVDSL